MLDNEKNTKSAGVSLNKTSEKTLISSLVSSIIVIILCMISLCTTTWAWYEMDLALEQNVIATNNCKVTVTIRNQNEDLVPTENKYLLEAGKEYEVEVLVEGTATTGYCAISDGEQWYVSQQIKTGAENIVAFTISVSAPTEITVRDGWGTNIIPLDERAFYDGKKYLDFEEVA